MDRKRGNRQGRRNAEGGRFWRARQDTTFVIEHAVGAQNLTKAVAARNGRHSRFGSDSAGEPKPRRVGSEGNLTDHR